MTLHRVTRFALALGLIGFPAVARAQAFGLNEIGSCALARGFATTSAPCDDGSSIYWNPGAIPKTKGLTAVAGVAALGALAGVGLINPASTSDDFMLTINPNLDNQFADLDWHLGGNQNGVIPIETQILRVLVGTSSPTPEPATWAMMLLGFAGIGLAMRRTRRLAAA